MLNDVCNTCGVHWMQNCAWWCGLSEQEVKEIQSKSFSGKQLSQIKELITTAIKELKEGKK